MRKHIFNFLALVMRQQRRAAHFSFPLEAHPQTQKCMSEWEKGGRGGGGESPLYTGIWGVLFLGLVPQTEVLPFVVFCVPHCVLVFFKRVRKSSTLYFCSCVIYIYVSAYDTGWTPPPRIRYCYHPWSHSTLARNSMKWSIFGHAKTITCFPAVKYAPHVYTCCNYVRSTLCGIGRKPAVRENRRARSVSRKRQ